jgi:hypothetical protein
MHKILRVAALLLSVSFTPSGEASEVKPLKVLFIGNSYTGVNDLPSMVDALSEAGGGRKIEAHRHLVGGCTLERHVKETGAIDKIRERNWDVVVLQEQSLRPVSPTPEAVGSGATTRSHGSSILSLRALPNRGW